MCQKAIKLFNQKADLIFEHLILEQKLALFLSLNLNLT